MNPSTASVSELSKIFEPVREELVRVEKEFSRHLESRVDLIPQMGKYIQMSGGKRVRPAVLLMAARLCGYQGDKAVLNAAVVEFIHTATLVHDDIIDEAETRRGRLSAHSRWGNDITVLMGDYLYIRSMALALTQDTLEVVRLLCDVTLKMIEGELFQLTKAGDADITEEEHFEIINRKTAHLFAGCAEIGGLLGKCSTEQREALRLYGFNLGLAFQIVDDVLDYTAEERVLGKPIGGDLREGKVTLPVIFMLQRTDESTRALVRDVVSTRQVTPEAWDVIKDQLQRHGAVELAYQRSVTYAEEAKRAITAAFGPSAERESLVALCDYVLSRDR
ncbi:MAG: polyprenyl synthetase family protein [Acidobacteria bacterium]|nr:polyprenyl synthetase family protein [Acidobacteriota bacterium]MBP8273881.1 polyprenyl synthetase family protein [Acidobacteriota bacterium]